ncbi:putative polyketide synthase 1 [Takifugu flavidus]|uniref:Putative polyketide synthase 1 n=1 Tax=Takifugu flavidus TaxID=433684 RepID=A0A5C6NT94_9TELE|nr:putative polyketide synthase 1 [Takifugu flavidus]
MEEGEDAVAVIGIGCNFPGGEGLDNFWKVLVDGKNCSVPIPRERFDVASWYDPDDNKAGKSRTARAALIDGFNEFDHKFFGISDSEVEQMDPQQKQLLQCVYRALEDAGVPMEDASGTRTGVFFGLMNRDYETNAAHVHPSVINHWTGTGLAMSIAANRVSYIFNFTGPSLSIDCACSSSLVALHLACQSIKQGDCDMAVCGGVSCIIEPRVFVALSKAKMISPDGTSKPFTTKADGYGRGEGCGVLLLKPLQKALRDHDHIWGIVSKTAVNQDGHSVTPITKPSRTQQEDLLRRIYSESDLVSVQYIEAHGTGTPAGDPTEAESISNVIAKAKPPGSGTLWIGSVKSNIGHTESAAGVAGLIKVLLMMKHQTIVPSVFYSEESASIDAKELKIEIPRAAERWHASGARVAGVNNFGFGGTNAHAIVKQYKQNNPERKHDGKQAKYFVMSANSLKSLTLTTEDTIRHLEMNNGVNLDSLVYTSACRRSHLKHRYRKAIVVSALDDLQEKLKASVGKNISPSFSDPHLVFVFCGNGVTYHGMCRQLLQKEPFFRNKIKEIAQLYQRLSPLNILDTLACESEFSNNSPQVVQPLLFAIQVGINALLNQWGVKPDAVLGHSVGEIAAAHCSGLLSLEDALKVLHFRSTLQTKVAGGKMLVVSNMSVSDVTAHLPKYSGKLCLAAFNSPQSCTISGDADAIDSLHRELRTSANTQSLFLRVLDVPAAYHSHMMDPILAEVKGRIGSLQINNINTELFSTVTGNKVHGNDFCNGEYWARNIREPVAFEQAGVKSDSLKWKPLSYFNSKKLMLLTLDKDGGHELSDIPIMPTKKQLFKKRAVYIVAGGLSGLGFETVKFISQRGGEYVVILSRSKPSPDVEQEIDNVEKQCRNCITAMECDVSVSESVNKVVSAIGQKFPGCPIRGVFHSAVVLHDGLIETLDLSLYEKVFRPKSINWGALNLGLLLNKEHFQRFLEAKGMMVLDVPEIHKSLEQCLVLNRPQQAVCRFHFRNIRYNILSQNVALTNRLSELVNEAFQKSKDSEQAKETQAVSPREYVISLLSETIGMDRSELRDESPLSSLGIDSMQAMTIQNLIFQEKGVNLPLVKLLDPNATISTVIGLLSEEDQSGYSSHIEVTVPDGDANDISTRL